MSYFLLGKCLLFASFGSTLTLFLRFVRSVGFCLFHDLEFRGVGEHTGNIGTSMSELPKRGTTTPTRQRVISESTGLVKFNITKKRFDEQDQATKEFQRLESKAHEDHQYDTIQTISLKKLATKRSMNHIVPNTLLKPSLPSSTTRAPPVRSSRQQQETGTAMIDENMLLELASKQREVLELKANMDELKQRLVQSERELREIESKCNRNRPSPPSPSRSPQRRGLSSKPSIQGLRASLQNNNTTTSNNFATLKKKISLPQLSRSMNNSQFNQQLNNNIQKFQKESNLMLERGLTFVNNLRNDMFKEEDERDLDDNLSDYGAADVSDYMTAVK